MAQTPFESYFLDLEYFILHNAYCAKQYKRECPCDNEGEWNWQVCRELNENECKDIVSYNGECYSYSPHGEQIFNTTKEPCYYCAWKLWWIEIWNNDNQDCRDISHDGLTVPCLGGGTYALKSYSECSTANEYQCGTWKYSHCKLDDSDSELSENICEAICVDEWGRLVDESLCNAYTRPLCTWPSPWLDPSYNDCNHCAKNWFPYCFPINFDLNCDESKY